MDEKCSLKALPAVELLLANNALICSGLLITLSLLSDNSTNPATCLGIHNRRTSPPLKT
jgi:hypothetical protein